MEAKAKSAKEIAVAISQRLGHIINKGYVVFSKRGIGYRGFAFQPKCLGSIGFIESNSSGVARHAEEAAYNSKAQGSWWRF
jgi:hypothetical protein